MLAANHSGGRLLGRPSIGAMFKSRAAAMYPYIRQQWVGSASSLLAAADVRPPTRPRRHAHRRYRSAGGVGQHRAMGLPVRTDAANPSVHASHERPTSRRPVATPDVGRDVRSPLLICASGAHSRPLIPEVSSCDGSVAELHSSALADPLSLRDRTVVIVGGGASAFDLLDLSFTHGAHGVHWVHRGVRWFSPTRQPNAVAGSIRNLARLQASGASVEQINQMIDADLRSRYTKFGLPQIIPSRPVDLRRDQLIPSRATMLSRFGDIRRHASTVESVSSGRVQLANADEIEADLLLWGTGYELDLRRFEDARIAGLQTLSQMAERCAGLCRSLDGPNLYFPAVGLDAAGATSWVFVMIARTILSDIRGTAHWPAEPLGRKLNHLEIARHLAEIDPASFPPGRGWEEIRQLALSLPDDQPYPMP
jgi:hypothetical protein